MKTETLTRPRPLILIILCLMLSSVAFYSFKKHSKKLYEQRHQILKTENVAVEYVQLYAKAWGFKQNDEVALKLN